MQQIKQISPIVIDVPGNRVVVPQKIFNDIIKAINTQAEVINALISNQDEANSKITALDSSIKNLANAIKNL